MGYLNEFSFLDPTIFMYHGSDMDLTTLLPTSYNAGHKLKKPSWSVFLWDQYNLAYKWALMRVLKNLVRKTRKITNAKSSVYGNHIKTGFNTYDQEIYVWENEYDLILKLVLEYQPKFYVYTIKVPIDLKLNLGNNNSQPEFTYDGELKIYKKDIYTLNDEVYRKYIIPLDDKEYNKMLNLDNMKNIRGPIGYLFRPTSDIIYEWKYVARRIKAGEIKPGDDLDIIMGEYYKNKDYYDNIGKDKRKV